MRPGASPGWSPWKAQNLALQRGQVGWSAKPSGADREDLTLSGETLSLHSEINMVATESNWNLSILRGKAACREIQNVSL